MSPAEGPPGAGEDRLNPIARESLEHGPFIIPAWAWLLGALAAAAFFFVGLQTGSAWMVALGVAVAVALAAFLAITNAPSRRARRLRGQIR